MATFPGCTVSREEQSLKALGIDDGAAVGQATDQNVEPYASALLRLDTGASLFVPEGAVKQSTRMGLRRIEDQTALQQIARLGTTRAVLSAPYAVTPYQDFHWQVELILPLSAHRPDVRVGFLSLDDARDEFWSEPAAAEVLDPGRAKVSLWHGGVLVAVDLDQLEQERGAGGEHGEATSSPNPSAKPADKVDMLFVIDNSGTTAEEQRKLGETLENLIEVLTTGFLTPSTPNPKPDFTPARSLHLGVVSSDMGVNGAPPQKGCGVLSFNAAERDPAQADEFFVKPLGDDGVLRTSTDVAVTGIYASSAQGRPELKVPADPDCFGITFPAGQRFVSFSAGSSDHEDTATRLRCIAKLGTVGCGLEQPLEAALKALTPSDSQIKFSGSATGGQPTSGQGDPSDPSKVAGVNRGFLREDAVLVVVFLSDEEDCSIPDASKALFDAADPSIPGELNLRCGLAENQQRLHPVQRYVDGLRALKPAVYQERIIVASIVGTPALGQLRLDGVTNSNGVIAGATKIEAVLNLPEMQFQTQRNAADSADEPVPACVSQEGDGRAAPSRRFLELTKAFGDNGVVSSICDASFSSTMRVIIDRVAAQLQTEQ